MRRESSPPCQLGGLFVGISLIPAEHGRFMADNIEGARYIELPGGDIGLTPAMYPLIDEVAEFVTGGRSLVEVERILTTILFTDVVASTERAAALGDQRWRTALDEHDRAVRYQLRRFRGREVNTIGDGFVTSFDGPAVSAKCGVMISAAFLSISLPGLRPLPHRERSWCREPSKTSSSDRRSSSSTVGSESSHDLSAVRGVEATQVRRR